MAPLITPTEIAANAEVVRGRIVAAGGDLRRVQLVAVTKAHPPAVARAALAAGLTALGENYAQDLLEKVADLAAEPPPVRAQWHFIGRLQSNKVRDLAAHVAVWHTVDRESIADAIGHRAPGATVLVQVNASGEPQKGGCPADPPSVAALVDRCRALGLIVVGLMAIGVAGDAAATRAAFRLTRQRADDLALPHCSMGMTADLEIAVEEGSTMVRVGSQLFGARPPA